MFRTTRGKIRGVVCAGLLLSGVTAGMSAILGDDEKEAQAAGIQTKVEQTEVMTGYYPEAHTTAYRMVEALVVEKASSTNSNVLILVYNNQIFNVEFNYFNIDNVGIGDTVTVRYYEGSGIMLED